MLAGRSVSVAVTVSPKTYNFLGLCFTIDINNQDTGGEGTGEIDKSSEENIIRHQISSSQGSICLVIISHITALDCTALHCNREQAMGYFAKYKDVTCNDLQLLLPPHAIVNENSLNGELIPCNQQQNDFFESWLVSSKLFRIPTDWIVQAIFHRYKILSQNLSFELINLQNSLPLEIYIRHLSWLDRLTAPLTSYKSRPTLYLH